MIADRRHTREIAALGGLQRAPLFADFTLVMLSSIGLRGSTASSASSWCWSGRS